MAKGKKRKYTPSSGTGKKRTLKRAMKRLDAKITRWKRYSEEVASGMRHLPLFKHGKKKGETNSNRWNISGLQSHCTLLDMHLKAAR